MYKRWTKIQSAEVKYAIDKIEEYFETGNRDLVVTALAQIRATFDTYGFRPQYRAFSHDPGLGEETR